MKLTDMVQGVLSNLATASKERINREKLRVAWHRVRVFWNHEWNSVSHRRLYAATAIASFTLFGVVYTVTDKLHGTQSWEQVYSDGAYVGMVPNSNDVVGAMKRIALGYHVDVRFVPVNMHVDGAYNWSTVATLPTPAAAILLNGHPLVYTDTPDDAHRVLDAVKATLTPENLSQPSQATFVGDVAVASRVVSVTDIMAPDAAMRYILQPTHARLSSRGETLSDISWKPRMNVSAPDNDVQPLLAVSTTETVTKDVSLPYDTHYISDNSLGVGAIHVTSPGKNGLAHEQIELSYVNGKLVSEKVLNKQVIQPPTTAVATKGTNPGVAVGDWGWPSASYTLTSGYGWRFGGREFHPGIDIGCPVGTPVYASNNGYIEDAGWNGGGYGIWIRINNGGGLETVFGHLSRVVVQSGQLVSKGQLIGYSGSTGESTGPHLHYEVRRNGVHIDPHPYM